MKAETCCSGRKRASYFIKS